MTAIILDGKKISQEINDSLIKRTYRIIQKTGKTPKLATILVGDNPSSVTYVKMKQSACKRAGFDSVSINLPDTSTTVDVINTIRELNQDENVYGILLQHPVPKHIDEPACFNAISEDKDVDGVNYLSFGRTAMNDMKYGCATPYGILKLLKAYNIELEGKEAVVVGASPILGKPMAAMLLNENATVTICHKLTKDLPSVLKRADIVVVGIGVPEFIQADWIKPGAIVIDAGYNKGNVGDTDLKRIKKVAGAYTPVPGGVGPMTIVTLIEQTVLSAERKHGI